MFTEADVFKIISEALDSVDESVEDAVRVPVANVTDEELNAPSEFPCLSIIEMDSYPITRYRTIDNMDSQRRSVFEVQAYSNDSVEGRYIVKTIMDEVEAEFRKLGYRCTTNQPIQNLADNSIKRRVARFTRTIGGADVLPTT